MRGFAFLSQLKADMNEPGGRRKGRGSNTSPCPFSIRRLRSELEAERRLLRSARESSGSVQHGECSFSPRASEEVPWGHGREFESFHRGGAFTPGPGASHACLPAVSDSGGRQDAHTASYPLEQGSRPGESLGPAGGRGVALGRRSNASWQVITKHCILF